MNIGIVTTWFERGAAYVSRAYYDALSSDNNVFIFARGGEEYALNDPEWDKDYVTWGKRFKDSWFSIDWLQFKKWIERNNIEIVIFNEQQDWEIVVDCQNLGIMTVAYIDYYTARTVPFFDIYDAVICHTKRHYSVFSEHHKSFYIPWGTDVDLFTPKKIPSDSNGQLVFFHSAGMGGIGLRKGTDLLVRAFDRVSGCAKLTIHSQVPVDHYGDVSDIIKKNESIDFIHKTVPAPGLYYLGDVYVYPSRLEGLGLTVIEALSSGLPVITTDCAPMNEFVEDGINGLLVDVDSYLGRLDGYYWAESHCSMESLSSKIQTLINDRSLVEQMKIKSRNYAIKYLDWNNNSLQLNKAMKSISNMGSNNHDVNNKLRASALYESYMSRKSGLRFDKRVYRKCYRKLMGLSF